MYSKARAVVSWLLETVVVPVESIMLPTFGKDFKALPPDVKEICHEKYHRWRKDPSTLSMEHKFGDWYVVELTRKFHAVARITGQLTGATVYWMRVLKYDDYAAYLTHMRKAQHQAKTDPSMQAKTAQPTQQKPGKR